MPPPIRQLVGLSDYPQLVLDVRSYGAKLDGTTDDSAALQAALNDAATRGGATIYIPGKLKLATGVSKSYTSPQLASAIKIKGDGSRSQILIGVGNTNVGINLGGLESLVFEDLFFVGTTTGQGGAQGDAQICVQVTATKQVLFRRCDFYGLYTATSGGSVLYNNGCFLKIKDCSFRGCGGTFTNSIVHCHQFGGISVEDTDFFDHGDLNGSFMSRTGDGTAAAWIFLEDVGAIVASDSQGVMFFRNLKFDEGSQRAISIVPNTAVSAKYLSVEAENLSVNVCSLASSAGFWGRWIERLNIHHSWFGYASLGQVDGISLTGVDRVDIEHVTVVGKANQITLAGGLPQVKLRQINPQGDAYGVNFGGFSQPTVYAIEKQGLPTLPSMTSTVRTGLTGLQPGVTVFDTTTGTPWVWNGTAWKQYTVA